MQEISVEEIASKLYELDVKVYNAKRISGYITKSGKKVGC